MDKIAIIGFGKLGSHLYYSLKKNNKTKVTAVFKNSRSKINPSIINNSDIIFICTQDSKISNAVKKLSHKTYDLKNKYVYHTSGSLTSDELTALRKKGAITGSFHPVQTFESIAKKYSGRFKDIYIAIEGEKKSIKKGLQVSRLIGAKTFVISKQNKVYHHICCVVASNFMTALMRVIEKIGAKKIQINGFKKLSFFNIYKPLAVQTLENIARKGAVKSLTGPIERNDLITITSHLKAISGEFFPVYLLLGIESVKLALEKKSIKLNEAKKILNTFDNYIKTSEKS